MDEQRILHATQRFIKKNFSGEGTGHDYFHIQRVVNTARAIAREESTDGFVIEIAAWLHDVGDYKLNNGVDRSEELIEEFLSSLDLPQDFIQKIIQIVSQVSFSKGNKAESLEAKIVQDADRLDAIGAIGVARAFAYGGSKNRELWNPESPENSTIQHFYDKLLKLKDLMNTGAAKKLAEQRHQFLEDFLVQFYDEWNARS